MSKASKVRSKQENLRKKRSLKQANKARYAALKSQGENTKSVRAQRNSKKKKLANRADHINGNCGNIACLKCVPAKLF